VKKAARERTSLTLELVKAQLDGEDAAVKAAEVEEARRKEACRRLFEPIWAMWLEVRECLAAHHSDRSKTVRLCDDMVKENDTELQFWTSSGSYGFTIKAYYPADHPSPGLYYDYGGSLGCQRTLEDARKEFIKYLAVRMRPVRKELDI